MNVYDISWPLSTATTGYKNKDVINFKPLKKFSEYNMRETEITLSSQGGTHVDAPSHMLKDGKTIDQVGLDKLIGPAVVLDLTLVPEKITRDDLKAYDDDIHEGGIILLKTANSLKQPTDDFTPHFVYLEHSGAQYLVEKKVKAVGIDYVGIERSQPKHPTHWELMSNDIAIIEGLRLFHVEPGHYVLVCLPLSVIGIDGGPARAVLLDDSE